VDITNIGLYKSSEQCGLIPAVPTKTTTLLPRNGVCMSTEWYYTTAGTQVGPVSDEQIKQMAADGTLRPDDMVWNQSMEGWIAASQVQELTFGTTVQASPLHAQTLSQSLAYEAPGSETCQVTPRSLELLRLTRPWVLTMSILMFIGVGFMLVGALGMLIIGIMGRGRDAAIGFGAAAGYIAIAALFSLPPFFLAKYSSRIRNLMRLRRAVDLEEALEAQKSYWKCLGITTIVLVALYIVGIVVVIIVSLRK
jgi:hypothetical protein